MSKVIRPHTQRIANRLNQAGPMGHQEDNLDVLITNYDKRCTDIDREHCLSKAQLQLDLDLNLKKLAHTQQTKAIFEGFRDSAQPDKLESCLQALNFFEARIQKLNARIDLIQLQLKDEPILPVNQIVAEQLLDVYTTLQLQERVKFLKTKN